MPEETVTIELDGKFTGWTAEMDADPDWGTAQAFAKGTVDGITEGIVRTLKSWTFKDREGKGVPANAEGIKRVPRRAIIALTNAYMDAYKSLPNS